MITTKEQNIDIDNSLLSQYNESIKSSKEKKALANSNLNKLKDEENKMRIEFIESIENELKESISHKKILKNTINNMPKVDISTISGHVEYTYTTDKLNDRGLPETKTRAFPLSFKHDPMSDEKYLVKIANLHLCKKDILSLYNAFRTVVSDKVNILVTNSEKNNEKLKAKMQAQLEIFKEQFCEPTFQDLPMDLYIKSNITNDLVELSFHVMMVEKEYAIRLNKYSYLSSQDIYYIYTNFENIINKLLQFKDSEEEEKI